MATIKAIEAQSVHQIQSGQVIVDLCSVVKELVENGLDAGASSIEVRFKNNGLDSIEVQDNGSGISPANYESVALKHHTSKLSGYEDLSSLQTFGFRGEALSSLCALSTFYMITAQADEAPKGKRLDFETSGKLKSTSVVACQKGTTATVEGLFESLPVRRKELAKNIKREYGKVIGLLHAYACVCTSVRFAVKNAMPKGNTMTVFATKSNATTRENIANVYGAKTLQALVALDLDFDFQPTLTQLSRSDANTTHIKVNGHISRPVWGEGRQTPDRQMFFVNGRPCGLPQVAKAMNEVYKSFNVSQSPFIFADFEMDTNAYDVNVSPDKRTILLHNATDLIEKLKESLNALFETQDQTVPQANVVASKLPAFKQLSIQPSESTLSDASERVRSKQKATSDDSNHDDLSIGDDERSEETTSRKMLHDHFRAQASTREEASTRKKPDDSKIQKNKEKRAEQVAKAIAAQEKAADGIDEYDDIRDRHGAISKTIGDSDDSGYDDLPTKAAENIKVRDFNRRMAEQQKSNNIAERPTSNESSPTGIPDRHEPSVSQAESEDHPNLVQNAFDRMRPHRPKAEVATITIGDHTTTAIVGSGISGQKGVRSSARTFVQPRNSKLKSASTLHFSQSLRKFGAPGTQGQEENFASEHQSAPKDGNARDESPEGESHEALRESVSRSPRGSEAGADDFDPDYIDQAKDKAEEETRVAELIRLAEESAAKPTKESLRRANKALKGSNHKDSTATLLAQLALPLDEVQNDVILLQDTISGTGSRIKTESTIDTVEISDEEKLSLTISKSDFASMEIIGQFNLGFILAVRKASIIPQEFPTQSTKPLRDELFIIDQHASDEKYNFERLQATTTVSNQRLVRPIILELTAVEEEIVLENLLALEKNGFIVSTDTTGDSPVGKRCKLLTLPLSKEVTFDVRDLDELIHLLSESSIASNSESAIPRPGKVRKMFAMRACRSSIMIGKTLSVRQMGDVLRHMGEIEKPWNCPHGRPTMRHLTSLNTFGGWREGAGLADEGTDGGWSAGNEMEVWRRYGAS
jgi:DNA mismatch repair protein PMS2